MAYLPSILLTFLIGTALAGIAVPAAAQGRDERIREIIKEETGVDPAPSVTTPEVTGTAFVNVKRVLIRQEGTKPPVEPYIKEVKFLKPDPPRTLGERVDALLHGIHTDLPPEYDHYGYEMRRYMAKIAGPNVLGDKAAMEAQLKNVAYAAVILQFWREAMQKEMESIEQEIATDTNITPGIKTVFRYNSGVANAFFAECQNWLDNNRLVLQFLIDKHGTYTYEDPVFSFEENIDRLNFTSLYKAQQESLANMRGYIPFMIMVY
jgi:hypothetical protein